MEKLGISREDLLKELKADYHETRRALSDQIKLGSANGIAINTVTERLTAIRTKIDELEAELKTGG